MRTDLQARREFFRSPTARAHEIDPEAPGPSRRAPVSEIPTQAPLGRARGDLNAIVTRNVGLVVQAILLEQFQHLPRGEMAPVASNHCRSIHPSTSPLPRQYQKPALTADHFTRIIAIQRFTGLSRNPDVSASSSWFAHALVPAVPAPFSPPSPLSLRLAALPPLLLLLPLAPLLLLLLLFLAAPLPAPAQTLTGLSAPPAVSQITGRIDENTLTQLPGNTYRLAKAAFDSKPVLSSIPQMYSDDVAAQRSGSFSSSPAVNTILARRTASG